MQSHLNLALSIAWLWHAYSDLRTVLMFYKMKVTIFFPGSGSAHSLPCPLMGKKRPQGKGIMIGLSFSFCVMVQYTQLLSTEPQYKWDEVQPLSWLLVPWGPHLMPFPFSSAGQEFTEHLLRPWWNSWASSVPDILCPCGVMNMAHAHRNGRH